MHSSWDPASAAVLTQQDGPGNSDIADTTDLERAARLFVAVPTLDMAAASAAVNAAGVAFGTGWPCALDAAVVVMMVGTPSLANSRLRS